MNEIEEFYKNHGAGAQDAAQSYHSYYFLLLLLRMEVGEKIGFEVKEDIHIQKADGTTEFIQIKHTIQKAAQGNSVNLTTLDKDLWKTLLNWLKLIQLPNFENLEKCKFILITNKEEKENKFQDALRAFKSKEDNDTQIFLNKISSISTNNPEIANCITEFKKLLSSNLRLFLNNLNIETGNNDVIKKIKDEILKKCMNDKYTETIFNSFCSQLQEKKYIQICSEGKYEISFNDFLKDFGQCMRIMYKNCPLPERRLEMDLLDNLESQIFIQQLLDIGDIYQDDSDEIRDFTFQKLHTINILSDWIENNEIYQFDLDMFEENIMGTWRNVSKEKYREIKKKINEGCLIKDLEEDIKSLAIGILDELRKKQMTVPGNTFPLSIYTSNGYLYLLSDELKIGWHYDWKNRYKNL